MKAVKHFTPAEANRTLPLVTRIVADILETGAQIRGLTTSRAAAPGNEHEIQKLVTELELLTQELERLGCQYKDWNFTMGLVDFPAIVNGEEVLLCWRSDEPEILHYHGCNEGYIGRKPIPGALLQAQ